MDGSVRTNELCAQRLWARPWGAARFLDIAFFADVVAWCLAMIASADNDYRPHIVVMIGGGALALLCCGVAFVRGGGLAKAAAIVLALPAVMVVVMGVDRAPGAFGV